MKKVRKIAAFIVIILIVLILIGVIGFIVFGETAIKTAVEKSATKTLGVNVAINNVSLSLLQGRVGIKGLVIDNPQGYQNKTLLQLADADVAVNIGSLMSDTVKINNITLDGTKLTIEQKGLTNNLKQVIDNLPKTEKETEQQPSGKKLEISKLEITGTAVTVKLLPVPGKVDNVTLNIDPIVMENLGTDSKLDAGILTAKVLTAIATGVAKQGAGVLPDDMIKGMGDALGAAIDLTTVTTQQGQKILESTGEAGKGVLEGLGGLLGGKKKQE
jgi:uncharacterized protein involved in outer membrane biogenesis